jgi:hypothetical protein
VRTKPRLALLALLAALVAAFFLSGAHRELEFENINAAFVMLGVLPLIARKLAGRFRRV